MLILACAWPSYYPSVFRVNVADDVFVNQVLRPIVVTFFQNHLDLRIVQYNKGMPQTANTTIIFFLSQQPFLDLDWLKNSGDISKPDWSRLGELNRSVRQHNVNNGNDLELAPITDSNPINTSRHSSKAWDADAKFGLTLSTAAHDINDGCGFMTVSGICFTFRVDSCLVTGSELFNVEGCCKFESVNGL